MVHMISLALNWCLFVFGIFLGFAPNPNKSDVWRIIGFVLVIFGLIGLVVTWRLLSNDISEKIQENNQKIEMVKERVSYNEKKQNELLTEKFKLPITDILIEKILETQYYKVTTNTGIYKIAFDYDSNEKIIGFKEFKQITSISQEGNHE
ncbi:MULTISPECIES: hypothetical protein [Bacillus]|uniref:DUF3139 domain-containing protein n=1 Tax=Bacillus paranthracis TaxID=2026186 RepID=A0AAX3QH51_9BACI|nr:MULTISPECIES: hypothetical protein [Bacillus]HDX9563666.1 hypothetical protein [Bacillus thuringiensis]MEC0899874.1 hypothetical protein [Bacillus anthracis]WES09647.1 hypothetical protein P3K65_27425 [Bacillus paranthracis]HDR4727459.1 hypothetical protein [Bacillus cereus]HDX9564503.1 hypothetical protein [Bacillus thuringiensis]